MARPAGACETRLPCVRPAAYDFPQRTESAGEPRLPRAVRQMMPPRESIFIYGKALEQGGYPAHCPFNTSRPIRTRKLVAEMGLLEGPGRREVAPDALTREEMEWFHAPRYLDALESAESSAPRPEMGLGTPDCPVFDGLYEYVRIAAGGSLTAARRLLAGEAGAVFNPAGGFHHAMPASAAGFCYLNDVVIAVEELARAGNRVCFLDIDAHHADGVQHAFYHRSDVLVVSLHESGETLFPGTGFLEEMGTGEGRGYTLNLPLPVGTYDAAFERVFREAAWPVIEAFDPDLLVLELGMDTLAGDPLAHLHLTNNVPAAVTARIMGMGKPVLAVGGGGYHLENTVRGWALCWSVLCGEDGAHDLAIGMGGVLLENTDWFGGLRDRTLLSDAGIRSRVDHLLDALIRRVRKTHFPLFGLG